jgi:hypothetical protein
MKHIPLAAISLAGAMLAATPALAITVTNRDREEHTFTVDKGEAQADQKLAAGASTEVECMGGCEVRVQGSGYGRSVETGDKLVIDDKGLLDFASVPTVTGSTNSNEMKR